jgi:hypothetical protein
MMKARVVVCSHNDHVRLLSPSLLVGFGTTKVYSADRSRHCHGINYTLPMKEDVKKKDFSPPLGGDAGVVSYIQPCRSREGDCLGRFGWPQIA